MMSRLESALVCAASIAWSAVMPEIPRTAAFTGGSASGLRASFRSFALAYWANDPVATPNTWSPAAKPVYRRACGDDGACHVSTKHGFARPAEPSSEADGIWLPGEQVPCTAVES